jgi:hypothetical protein
MQAHRERCGGDLGPPQSQGTGKEANLFMMLSYAQGRYWMVRRIPLS